MDKFDKTIDTIQEGLVWFVIAIITLCIAVLFLFDVLAGTGTMMFLTNGKEWQSVVISLATTGLLFALMFIGYSLFENKSEATKSVGAFVLFFAFLIYVSDVIFDALLADILRYGIIMAQVDLIHWLFRFLLGGISTIGDALAIAMVLGMPVLKSIIRGAIKTSPANTHQPQKSTQYIPSHKPNFNPVTKPYPTQHPVNTRGGRSEPTYQPFRSDD